MNRVFQRSRCSHKWNLITICFNQFCLAGISQTTLWISERSSFLFLPITFYRLIHYIYFDISFGTCTHCSVCICTNYTIWICTNRTKWLDYWRSRFDHWIFQILFGVFIYFFNFLEVFTFGNFLDSATPACIILYFQYFHRQFTISTFIIVAKTW